MVETDNQIETNNAQLHTDGLPEKQDGSSRLAAIINAVMHQHDTEKKRKQKKQVCWTDV